MYLLIIIGVLVFIKFHFKIKIKWKTFLKKGFKVRKGIFGIYTYVGFQGDGKSYSCAEYVKDNQENITLFSNMHIEGINYIPFKGFKEMLKLRDTIDYNRMNNNNYIIFNGKKYNIDWSKQIVFIYDEIFSELQRSTKLSTDILDFISQMRKRSFILLTTAQIWSEIPIAWRKLCRYQIECKMRNLFFTNILIKRFYDAEQMKWSNDDQEHIAPLISTTITHTRLHIADSYDTYQLIHNKDSSFLQESSTLAEKGE